MNAHPIIETSSSPLLEAQKFYPAELNHNANMAAKSAASGPPAEPMREAAAPVKGGVELVLPLPLPTPAPAPAPAPFPDAAGAVPDGAVPVGATLEADGIGNGGVTDGGSEDASELAAAVEEGVEAEDD